ncbi:MAG: transcriptional regulator, LuxR family [Frankiales bacterium]|nr:transcriptional regulator, LuxR family [Frankiales bacterium]
MQQLLDLDEPTLAVYRALLRRPEDHVREPESPQVRQALARLVAAGLVRRRPDTGGHVAERPDSVTSRALAEEQRALDARQEQLARARREITDLVELYVTGLTHSAAPVEVERIETIPALEARLDELAAGATHELLTIGVTASYRPEDVPALRARDQRSWARGARSRTIYPASIRDADHLMAYALEGSAVADEYRVLERPPMTLVVIDRRVGVIPLEQAHLDRGAHVVWSPSIVAAFVQLFELAWDAAEPLFSASLRAEGDPLSPRDRRLLELLAAGIQDEAVSRQLGVGLRTVRRDAARLMEELGAGTRFQAGVEAARRGWL